MKKPLILCILDGWGYNGLPSKLYEKETPFLHSLFKDYPWCLLDASGESVGLPQGQMGNSEVGHLTLGAGRVILQDLPRINKTLETDKWTQSEAFQNFVQKTKAGTGTCHLLTMLSKGGVHSHICHSEILAKALEKEGVRVVLHGIGDGRDVGPHDLFDVLGQTPLKKYLQTLTGRYFMMDRDKRFDRTQKAYNLLTQGEGTPCDDFEKALKDAYASDQTDEFLAPMVSPHYKGMKDGDSLLVTNFRADRIRQTLRALLNPNFDDFNRNKTIHFSSTLGMVPYSDDLDPLITPLFGNHFVDETLGEVLSKQGLKQFRLAETEKYAHVTFFFNGGIEKPFENEDRTLIPSPKVAYYDQKPEMSSEEVTETLIKTICDQKHDFILVNYANPDMIGHTGNLEACKNTMEALDHHMKNLVETILKQDAELIITADHGNIEDMHTETGAMTYHTLNPVPCLFIGMDHIQIIKENGSLGDIAPTVLSRFGLECPSKMTGDALIKAF